MNVLVYRQSLCKVENVLQFATIMWYKPMQYSIAFQSEEHLDFLKIQFYITAKNDHTKNFELATHPA